MKVGVAGVGGEAAYKRTIVERTWFPRGLVPLRRVWCLRVWVYIRLHTTYNMVHISIEGGRGAGLVASKLVKLAVDRPAGECKMRVWNGLVWDASTWWGAETRGGGE
jgi:hypothetical protein